MKDTSKKPIKIAIIGSGLAGLSTAYLLSNANLDPTCHKQVEVHLFERNTSVGMDASSISTGDDGKQRIDVPMRSFMSGYYSHLFKLYQHLKIPIKKARFSFGWYRIQSKKPISNISPSEDILSYTEHKSYLVYSGSKTVGHLSRVTDVASHSFLDYLLDLGRFFWRALVVTYSYLWLMTLSLWMYHRGHLSNPEHTIHNLTLGDFFKKYYLNSFFVNQVFVPLFAAVCTNSYQSMHAYPAADILEYMAVGLFQESYIVSCGVQYVVETISKPIKHIHLETQIINIKPSDDNIHRFILEDNRRISYKVHHIIFATQGNQASCMLKNYHQNLLDFESSTHEELQQVKNQINMLGHFKYDKALVINHTDTRLLPSDKSNWKALNFALVNKNINPGKSEWIVPFPHDTTMTTHILNMTHHALDKDGKIYMQTTNPCVCIDPKQVLSVAWFERATVTLNSKKQLEKQLFEPRTLQEQEEDQTSEPKLGACQGKNNIWFVGSYCWKGIPLLEGCVASAELVVTQGISQAEGLPIKSPW